MMATYYKNKTLHKLYLPLNKQVKQFIICVCVCVFVLFCFAKAHMFTSASDWVWHLENAYRSNKAANASKIECRHDASN